ncbi:MAG: hypothetical protein MHM6MM_007537 [Cercozoa sp. M6MM]
MSFYQELHSEANVPTVNESRALLDDRDDPDTVERMKAEGIDLGQSDMKATMTNVMNNVMGAGLLTLPWGMRQGSIIPSIFFMIVTGVLGAYAMYLIARCCDAAKEYTFHGLWTKCWGKRNKWLVNLILFLTVCGTCISYAVLIGNFLLDVSANWIECGDEELQEDCPLLRQRWFVVGLSVLLVVLPLASLKSLHSLRFTSVLGVAAILYTLFLVIISSAQRDGNSDTVHVFRVTQNLFTAIALMNVSYTCHYNGARYYGEMRDRSPRKFMKTVAMSFGGCFVVYLAVSLAGYLEFGHATEGDILKNYPNDALQFIIARVAMAACIIFTFPLPFNSLRQNLDSLMFKPPVSNLRHYGITVAMVAITTIVGIAFPKVEIVLAYKGATLGTLIVYVIPAWMYLKLVPQKRALDKFGPLALIFFGVATGITGCYSTATAP